MRKIIWALPLATALAMAVGVPSASADSITRTISVPDHYISSTDTQYSSVTGMHVGDCTMHGDLYLSRPYSSGETSVRFDFATSTSHTSNFDQWHNSWKFLDSSGRQVGAAGTIDGLRMPTANVTYDGEINTTISMTASQWARIATVAWTGEC